MKTIEQITEILENLSDGELLSMWNDYQAEIRGESAVYDFDEQFFEDYFSSPIDAARAVYFGKIDSWANKYIMFNGYANLETSNYPLDLISVYDLASHIEGKQDEYSDLLSEIETEEED